MVPVHRMMRCPMVEENMCLKVVGAEFHGNYSVLLVGCWCWVGLGAISMSRQIGQLGMGCY